MINQGYPIQPPDVAIANRQAEIMLSQLLRVRRHLPHPRTYCVSETRRADEGPTGSKENPP